MILKQKKFSIFFTRWGKSKPQKCAKLKRTPTHKTSQSCPLGKIKDFLLIFLVFNRLQWLFWNGMSGVNPINFLFYFTLIYIEVIHHQEAYSFFQKQNLFYYRIGSWIKRWSMLISTFLICLTRFVTTLPTQEL